MTHEQKVVQVKDWQSEQRDEYSEHRFQGWTETEISESIEDILEENTEKIKHLRQNHQLIGSYIYELERRQRNVRPNNSTT